MTTSSDRRPHEPHARSNAPGGRWRHGLLLLAILAGPAAAYWTWSWLSVPRPPEVSLAEVDPAVAEAIRSARRRIDFAPRSPAEWGLLGMVLAANGFEEHGRECFRVAERLDPHDPRWPYFQAPTGGTAVPQGTVEALPRAALLCGDEAAPRLRLGEVLVDCGRLDEAEAQFDDVLRRSPDDARALLGKGRLAFAREQWEQAIRYLERSLTHKPNLRAAHALLAQAQFRLGNPAAAEQSRRAAAELPEVPLWQDRYLAELATYETGPMAVTRRADLLRSNGEIDAALALARAAVESYPDSAHAHFILGRTLALHRSDEAAAAESALREALRLQPDAPEAFLFLGQVLSGQSRHADAAECYRQALRLRENYAAAYFDLGKCMFHLHDRTAAIEALREAARLRPDWAAAHKNLAAILLDDGHADEALAHARRALELQADDETRDLVERLESLAAPVLPPTD